MNEKYYKFIMGLPVTGQNPPVSHREVVLRHLRQELLKRGYSSLEDLRKDIRNTRARNVKPKAVSAAVGMFYDLFVQHLNETQWCSVLGITEYKWRFLKEQY